MLVPPEKVVHISLVDVDRFGDGGDGQAFVQISLDVKLCPCDVRQKDKSSKKTDRAFSCESVLLVKRPEHSSKSGNRKEYEKSPFSSGQSSLSTYFFANSSEKMTQK